MGMCKNVTNCNLFVMDYLMEMYNFTIVSFHFLLIKKIFFICIKSPSCPYKNDLIHRVRLGHLLGLKIKMHEIFQKLLIGKLCNSQNLNQESMHRNYSARGLIVKYVQFVLISILKCYLSTGSSLSDKYVVLFINWKLSLRYVCI